MDQFSMIVSLEQRSIGTMPRSGERRLRRRCVFFPPIGSHMGGDI